MISPSLHKRYERKHERLAPVPVFLRRLFVHLGVATLLIFAALLIGILGYYYLAGLSWIDALLNASMILGGMGPIDDLQSASTTAKVFASLYALFCGLIFVLAMGIVLGPLLHRMVHKFHLDEADEQS